VEMADAPESGFNNKHDENMDAQSRPRAFSFVDAVLPTSDESDGETDEDEDITIEERLYWAELHRYRSIEYRLYSLADKVILTGRPLIGGRGVLPLSTNQVAEISIRPRDLILTFPGDTGFLLVQHEIASAFSRWIREQEAILEVVCLMTDGNEAIPIMEFSKLPQNLTPCPNARIPAKFRNAGLTRNVTPISRIQMPLDMDLPLMNAAMKHWYTQNYSVPKHWAPPAVLDSHAPYYLHEPGAQKDRIALFHYHMLWLSHEIGDYQLWETAIDKFRKVLDNKNNMNAFFLITERVYAILIEDGQPREERTLERIARVPIAAALEHHDIWIQTEEFQRALTDEFLGGRFARDFKLALEACEIVERRIRENEANGEE